MKQDIHMSLKIMQLVYCINCCTGIMILKILAIILQLLRSCNIKMVR